LNSFEFLKERQKQITFEEHFKKFGPEEFVNKCLKKNIPTLDFANWNLLELRTGYCKSVIPLVSTSKNQHISHQASLYLLSADYTGGLAISSHIVLPTLGIHPKELYSDYGIVSWLLHSEIKFLKASTNNMFTTVTLTDDEIEKITNTYYKKGRVIQTVNVSFTNNENELLGKAKMKYMMLLMSVEEWNENNNNGVSNS
jgi:hypothetical protein